MSIIEIAMSKVCVTLSISSRCQNAVPSLLTFNDLVAIHPTLFKKSTTATYKNNNLRSNMKNVHSKRGKKTYPHHTHITVTAVG